GDDAETLQALNIMITKGIAGYRETAAKLENQATLRERVEASLNTLGNKWEAAGGSFTNAMASIGETVAPVLKNIADWLGDLASALD
ncbi:phage tail tape measure protein, partial [Escherichia coli]|nr:phage tail tape measure protein [Escherichia coli]